ncbi:MAG: Nif3-like dinuclear metal center hexameric protein [Desulfatibacillaceae bacterium]
MSEVPGTRVRDVIRAMERLAPADSAEDWDNPGLQAGDRGWGVDKVGVALDPLPEVVEQAVNDGVDMLICHHPLIMRPLSSLDLSTPIGKILEQAIKHRLALYCAHTNLDRAPGGVNDVLADRLGLSGREGLTPSTHPEAPRSLGVVGDLPEATVLGALARRAREVLGLSGVRIAGDPGLEVRRVAVCGGSGRSLLKDFFRSGAQAYLTGDTGYHDARTVEAMGLGLVDIGHFGSEVVVVPALARMLADALAADGHEVEVVAMELERDPFAWA